VIPLRGLCVEHRQNQNLPKNNSNTSMPNILLPLRHVLKTLVERFD
jgi:hypothetical protein